MKKYEITVRVTHDVSFVAEAENVLKAGEMAMKMAAGLYDGIVDMRCVDGDEIKEEVKHED